MLEFNLSIKKETTIKIDGRNVRIIEYENSEEEDFLKVCTYDHRLGVKAEYAWLKQKYKNHLFLEQKLTTIKFNNKKIECDILIIVTEDNNYKEIYFDISQMMENIRTVNKEHWEEKAKIIYEKLIQDFGFSVYNNDEESLFKEINENVGIGFDITYFIGIVINGNKIDKTKRNKYRKIFKKYLASEFICNIVNTEILIGGYIKIDDLEDINIVFENYKKLENECREI